MTIELVKAIKSGSLARVKQLLEEEGVNPNNNDDDDTKPIVIAAETGQDSIVELLLDHGANINAITKVRQFKTLCLMLRMSHLLFFVDRINCTHASCCT